MKRWLKIAIPLCILAAAVLFFPIKRTYTLSGDGAVLTLGKEKVGDCTMSVEIQELKSLAMSYRKTFSFVLDGVESPSDFIHFDDEHYSKTPGIPYLLTQACYSGPDDRTEFYTLLYAPDLSYAVLKWGDNLYFLDNGANMAFSEIPFSHVGE
ncbi:MAG: hypothetical protein Q4F17_04635 [Eubacteriales bacterium]|nr:hypothetical protein [Eubacteriales bacterium]